MGSNPTLSAKIKRDLHQVPFYFGGVGCVGELTEFDKIAWSDFGRRERVGPKGCGQEGRSNPTRAVRFEQIEGLWRGGRAVEGARLESVYTGNRIVGSNPTPSARTLGFLLYFRPYCEKPTMKLTIR